MGLFDLNEQEALNLGFAGMGTHFISDNTQAFSGLKLRAIIVLTDTKFHTLTDASRTDNALAAAKLADAADANNCITVPAGTVLYGIFTAVRIHSGAILGIKGV
ncbi:MAG: hypothetical protein ACM3QX_18200 [Syntrophomonadaceae bacterium]